MFDKSRKTGFDCPLSLYQIITYITNISSFLIQFTQLIPYYSLKPQIIFSMLTFAFFFLSFYFQFKLTKSDPTDPTVINYQSADLR